MQLNKITISKFLFALTCNSIISLLFILVNPGISFAELTCDSLNKPGQVTDTVFTIIEEPMGDSTDKNSLYCYRQTELTGIDCPQNSNTKEGKCRKSTYTKTCSPSPDDTVQCKRIQVIQGKNGIEMLYNYIGLVYRWAARTIGIVCVFFIIWGGFDVATAGDNSGKLDEAKKRIIQSLSGLVLLFLSAMILHIVNPNFYIV